MTQCTDTPVESKVCAIIPAFNEETRVGDVVRLAVSSELFSQVLVVDDGSADGTSSSAQAAGAQVIRHGENQGKPSALVTGLKGTTDPVVCFLDADLTGLTCEHLAMLVKPVISGSATATMGVFKGGKSAAVLAQKICPMLSGQRCLLRSTLEGFTGWDSGFGIETALNDYLLKQGIEQQLVEWAGAGQVHKEEKRGFLKGFFVERLAMYRDILRTWLKTKLRRG